MTTPNSKYTQAFSAAIANYRDSAANDVLANNALLLHLSKRNNVDTFDGGVEITEQVLFSEVSATGWYSGSEVLDTSSTEVLTSANFAIKQHYSHITQSGLEEIQNSGESQMIKLIEAKIEAAMSTSKNAVSKALFFSNTEHSGKAIGGLQHLVADAPTTGTVGGIDAATNTWWRNVVIDLSNESLNPGSTPEHMIRAINLGFLRTNRGSDMVDVIVAGDTYFSYFEQALQPNQRFLNAEMAKVGFKAYEHKGAMVIHDPHCSATRMYGLNTKFVFFRPHKDRFFKIDDLKRSVNQDAWIYPIWFAGNLTISSRKRHFVIVA